MKQKFLLTVIFSFLTCCLSSLHAFSAEKEFFLTVSNSVINEKDKGLSKFYPAKDVISSYEKQFEAILFQNKGKDEIETVIFIPESELSELFNASNFDFKEDDEDKTLKLSDEDGDIDTQHRLKRTSSFLFLGGLSVTRSIERSLKNGTAEDRLSSNFTNPVRSAREGWESDDNAFLINYVGHPLEWFLLANYLKASGATDKEAIVISQLTSITWEFVVEGSYVGPSPKDLAVNTLGSLAGVYLYNTILNKPANATYRTITSFGDKHGIDIAPQLKYNPDTKGMIFSALVKIKR